VDWYKELKDQVFADNEEITDWRAGTEHEECMEKCAQVKINQVKEYEPKTMQLHSMHLFWRLYEIQGLALM